jgi:hypothetical protein
MIDENEALLAEASFNIRRDIFGRKAIIIL